MADGRHAKRGGENGSDKLESTCHLAEAGIAFSSRMLLRLTDETIWHAAMAKETGFDAGISRAV